MHPTTDPQPITVVSPWPTIRTPSINGHEAEGTWEYMEYGHDFHEAEGTRE